MEDFWGRCVPVATVSPGRPAVGRRPGRGRR